MDFKVEPGKHGFPKNITIGAKGFGVSAGRTGGSINVPDLRPLLDPAANPLLPPVPGALRDLASHFPGGSPDQTPSTQRTPDPPPTDTIDWNQPGGMWDVRIHMEGVAEDIELVVDAAALTLQRVARLNDAYYRMDAGSMAASIAPFIKRWNLRDEAGALVGIDGHGVLNGDPDLVMGVVTELMRAFDTLPERPDCAFRNPETGLVPVVTRSERRPDGSAGQQIVFDENPPAPTPAVTPEPETPALPAKSLPVTYALWLATGLVGGHRYYLGHTESARKMTMTLGGLGVWWLSDVMRVRELWETRPPAGPA